LHRTIKKILNDYYMRSDAFIGTDSELITRIIVMCFDELIEFIKQGDSELSEMSLIKQK
jgi:hypothetical protein